MLIDWFTVTAQIINFLLLIWLLKRFLYQPILNALQAREEKIASELACAAEQKQQAQLLQQEFTSKNQAFEKQRAELLKQALTEATLERQRLIDQARQETQTQRLQQQKAIANEQHSLLAQIQQNMQNEVFAITRKVLTDLAHSNLEEQIILQFLQRLAQMSLQQKQVLFSSEMENHLIIRTGFTLSSSQIMLIEQAVKQHAGVVEIDFQMENTLIAGIELSCNGQKIAWSMADYLTHLEKKLTEMLPDNQTSAQI